MLFFFHILPVLSVIAVTTSSSGRSAIARYQVNTIKKAAPAKGRLLIPK